MIKITANRKIIDRAGLAHSNQQNILGIKAEAEAEGKPQRMVGASKKAAGLLGRFAPEPKLAPKSLAHEPQILKEQRELSSDIAAVQEAITILRPQLNRAHLDGSAQLCDLLRPQYQKIAKRICAALLELGRAEIEHRDFMHRQRAAARATLRPIYGMGALGDPRDSQSEIRRLLYWAAECGHFDLADLSADWPGPRSSSGIRSWPVGPLT